ncbi:MAG: phage tail protein [Bacteroidetes bacterium]|nr:phage tail protein [Bacteroidota bacterium]MCL2302089.1 phage tail protein [Lentimicrobiaceae bacterium]
MKKQNLSQSSASINRAKSFLACICCALFFTVQAQNSGLGFNYQAVIRNAYGFVLQDSAVILKVSLYPGQQAVTPTWVETHNVQTDKFGTMGIRVGHGTRDNASVAAQFSDVNFAAVYYWLKIEINEAGTFREVSFTSLPSAPYSEVAHNAAAVPAGMVMAFVGDIAQIPDGWMLCDGRQLSRSQYANLYNAIGVAWGTGDNANTFNIPDMRGVFLRGVSYDSGNDPDAEERIVLAGNGANSGNNVGSYQVDDFKSHKHTNNVKAGEGNHGNAQNSYPAGYTSASGNRGLRNPNTDYINSNEINVSGGNETRPKNVYVNYIIKL